MKIVKITVFLLVLIITNASVYPRIPGNVIFLDGSGGGLKVKDINSRLDDLRDQMTIEAWIYPISPFNSNYPRIVDRSDDHDIDRFLFYLDLFNEGVGLNINKGVALTNTIIFNEWYHVAATYDCRTAKVYMNGELKDMSPLGTMINVTESDIYIGNNDLNNRVFHGAIDEVRIWNTVRTETQIRRTMNDVLGSDYINSADSGLVAYWRFDSLYQIISYGDTLQEIKDISINENHGKLLTKSAIISSKPRIHILEEFSLLEPKHDATLQTLDPVFVWQKANKNRIYYPIEVQYQLFIDEDMEFSSPEIVEIYGDTSVVVQNLEKGKTYFWKVMAKNVIGEIKWSTNTNGFYIDCTVGIEEYQTDPSYDQNILYPNYPNPFNPVTKIRYYLAKPNFVSIKIYNLVGEEVTTIINDYQMKGIHEVIWDGKKYPSGLYFCRMKTDASIKIAKLLLQN